MPGPGGSREWGMTTTGYRSSSEDDENVLELVMTAVQPCEYTKRNLTVFLKLVMFMVCELQLNKHKNNSKGKFLKTPDFWLEKNFLLFFASFSILVPPTPVLWMSVCALTTP